MGFEDMLVASHRPGQSVDKGLVHLFGEALDARFTLLDVTTGGNRIFATTLASLTAATSDDGDFAVIPKSAGAESGLYLKVSGAWAKQAEWLDLSPAGVVPLTVTNSDGDALTATSTLPLPDDHTGYLFTLTVAATNTTEGATLEINGSPAIPILTSVAAALPVQFLPTDSVVLLLSRGDAVQLISYDQIAATAQASADAAAASADSVAGVTAAVQVLTDQTEAFRDEAETFRDQAQGVSLGNTDGVPNVSGVPGSTASDALESLYASHKGPSRPTGAIAGTIWLDDTGAPWLLKHYDGTDDITLARINATDNTVEWAQSAEHTLASAATVDLGSKTGRDIRITGTNAITSFGTADAGVEKVLRFTNALTLTHNATSLILPTGANIITAAGDVAVVRSEGSGNWRCTGYMRANGEPVAFDPETLLADTDDNLTAGYSATGADDGTISSGTYTPTPAGGNLRHYTNGGAHTFEAPTATGDYNLTVQITNNASAGAITLSGFTKTSGDDFTTTDGDDFMVHITKNNGFTTCFVEALQ